MSGTARLDCDVCVVGAGPAGSSVAALLARGGVKVVVLEGSPFPRFHIGESLLPLGLSVLDDLGVRMDGVYLRKRGAIFVHEATGRSSLIDFRAGMGGLPDHAYQVERALFDRDLAERAAALGAELRYGVEVRSIETGTDDARVETDRGTVRARFVVDASGQSALLGRKHRSLVPYQELGKKAVFCHFSPLSDEAYARVSEDGSIFVFMLEDGWAWGIPLVDRKLSVGVVSRHASKGTDLLDRFLASSPLLAELTRGATRTEPRQIANFSYRNARSSGPRWACNGDAACFLDPVFSSGVSLALEGGRRLAAALLPALAEGREGAPDLLDPHHADLERGYETLYRVIHRFYHTRFVENLIFGTEGGTDGDEPLRPGIVSVLAGDVWRRDNPFQEMLLGRRRREPTRRDPRNEPEHLIDRTDPPYPS